MKKLLLITATAALIGACHREDESHRIEAELTDSIIRAQADSIVPRSAAAPADIAAARQYADSLDRVLRKVRTLTRAEQRRLRRDVNATQVARARQLGIRPTGSMEDLVEKKRLEKLSPNGVYYTLYRLDYSVPYVTPSTARLIDEIAVTFRAKTDSLGMPPVRLVITSALRTPENQAKLRRRNRNASRTVSAHEFATTVDIAYRRFAGPGGNVVTDSIIGAAANKRSAELQAILGRVLLELKNQGKVMVMMERAQTVYHITVARRLAAR